MSGKELAGKVVLITGAAKNIGRATALAFAAGANYRVNVYQAVKTDAFTLSYAEFWDGFRRLLGSTRLVSTTEPILDAMLKTGRSPHPPHPWLGIYTQVHEGNLVIGGLAPGGPADQAGLRVGDLVIAVGESRARGLAAICRIDRHGQKHDRRDTACAGCP